MHHVIEEHIEALLAERPAAAAEAHLAVCPSCQEAVQQMRGQARLLRTLRPNAQEREVEPRAGFYARVMERIEAEGPLSIWTLINESVFGRRIAFASLGLAVLLGLYLVSLETSSEAPSLARDSRVEMTGPNEDGVLTVSNGFAPAGSLETGFMPDVVFSLPEVEDVNQGTPAEDNVLVDLAIYRSQ